MEEGKLPTEAQGQASLGTLGTLPGHPDSSAHSCLFTPLSLGDRC